MLYEVITGLAYALRAGKERIERRSGTPITALRVSGGGSQSRIALQLTADIFGLPTGKPHLYETSGLGAAIDAAMGVITSYSIHYTKLYDEKNGILGHGMHHPFRTMFEDVFEELPWHLKEQAAQATREREIKWPDDGGPRT